MKQNLLGLNLEELGELLADFKIPSYRLKQLWFWIYNQGVTSFELMTNLPKNLREELDEKFTLSRFEVSKDLISFDETRKWLLKFADNNEVEAVFIPEKTRGTLCVSSQVGCTLTCKFCHTGTQKLVRNLTPSEIVAQFMHTKDELGDWPVGKENKKLTNVVLMGMGEPLFNYENVANAMKILMDPEGIALFRKKITLSTSGVVPMIEKCGQELGVNLAISLHAVNNQLRDHLVPINKKYPLEELLDACRNYPALDSRSKITFEYVMLKGVNDSVEDAKELVRIIQGIPAKINLIPFNPWPGTVYECSSGNQIRRFVEVVEKAGYMSPVRKPRGQDILAACGQLKSESQREKRKSQ